MGQITPNISIYVPAAGETNYDASFLAGMINIDQHDHSGPPDGGVPIATSGLADDSVTYIKLNANVVDTSTGLDTNGAAGANQIRTTGVLNNLNAAYGAGVGFPALNGTVVTNRTIVGTANQVAVTNPDGLAGNPTIGLTSTIYTNISFDSGANTLQNYVGITHINPTISIGGSSVGITYTQNDAYYIQIGKAILFYVNVVLSANGGLNGNVLLLGLPTATLGAGFPAYYCQNQNITYTAGYTELSAEFASATTIQFLQNGSGVGALTLQGSAVANTAVFAFSGIYFVS